MSTSISHWRQPLLHTIMHNIPKFFHLVLSSFTIVVSGPAIGGLVTSDSLPPPMSQSPTHQYVLPEESSLGVPISWP